MTRSRARGRSRAVLAVVAFLLIAGCADSATERRRETTKASYDAASGRLKELTYDANGNGRVDTWTEMDGARPVRSRIDRDEDGRIDRWEYYDAAGTLAKVGFSRHARETPDAWAFPNAAGRIARIESSSSSDEARIDRWEYYDVSAPPDAEGLGPLLRAEEDTNGDGRPDRFETWTNGAVTTVEFDENHDGRRDRRLTYRGSTLVLIETEPDSSGRYTKRSEIK